jgi:hypothetical protein
MMQSKLVVLVVIIFIVLLVIVRSEGTGQVSGLFSFVPHIENDLVDEALSHTSNQAISNW